MRIQIDHLKFGLVWYSGGHCIIIHNFLQNNFDIGEDLSSSDGYSVTISSDSAEEPEEPQPATPQPATPQAAEPQAAEPLVRKSKRTIKAKKLFTL